MGRVAVVTDSASDLPPDRAARHGIVVVPLIVRFGEESFRAGVDLSTDAFWERMLAPGAPFPTTAAAAPGDFQAAFEAAFAAGADAIVCITVGSKLSGTFKSAEIARGLLADREIHVVDSQLASMGVGMLAEIAAEMAAAGAPAADIARLTTEMIPRIDLYVAIDTLEYLRRGGRISAAQAAIGGVLSVKPIITVRDGVVETADRVRTRGKARERVLELLTAKPVERAALLYTPGGEIDAFRAAFLGRVPGGIAEERVTVQPVGASVGPHLGPGCVGGVVLRA
ncbi:MAG: fatty acid-binding protein DegV [Chloroflexota bacterium]|nr:MAG: fatty acid-binding protein DegV [Chloroflexota bacterium]